MKNAAALALVRAIESTVPVKGQNRLRQMSKREAMPKRFKRPREWRPQ